MSNFTLTNTLELVTVAIRVKNRDKMIAFFRDCLGFALKGEENALAIMGTADSSKEQLWLEESPRAKDHFGQVKKLQSFTMQVATVSELSAIYQRLVAQEGTKVEALFSTDTIAITFDDPEENGWILEANQEKESIQDVTALIAVTDELSQKLSNDTYIKTVHMNSLDEPQQQAFLTTVLGLQATQDSYQLPAHPWSIQTSPATDPVIALDNDEVIGLEFLKFAISAADLQALADHLTQQKQTFYMDKKQSILTVYDAVGVEWWFLRQ